jgi:hypothetical protein
MEPQDLPRRVLERRRLGAGDVASRNVTILLYADWLAGA